MSFIFFKTLRNFFYGSVIFLFISRLLFVRSLVFFVFVLFFFYLDFSLFNDFSLLMLPFLGRRFGRQAVTAYKNGSEIGQSIRNEHPNLFEQRRGITFVFSGKYGEMPCNHPIAGVFGLEPIFISHFFLNGVSVEIKTTNVTEKDGKILGVGITKATEINGVPCKYIGKDNKGQERYLSDNGELLDKTKWHSKTHYRPRTTEDQASIEINLIKDNLCKEAHARACEEFKLKNPTAIYIKGTFTPASLDPKIVPKSIEKFPEIDKSYFSFTDFFNLFK